LNLTTKEFGGTSQIEVNVTPKQDSTPTPVPGGSSSGSGGTGAGPMVDKIME
jgi:Asp-tRNA(Asn)/Glu-tRNA(Gln) amidotransferase A subunit family amidase